MAGNYSQAIGSSKRGNVRFWQGKEGSISSLRSTCRRPTAAKALMDTFDVADVYARPVLDVDASTFTREGTARPKYTDAQRAAP